MSVLLFTSPISFRYHHPRTSSTTALNSLSLLNASISSPRTRVCRVCKKTFDPNQNTATSCVYHPEPYRGRLLRVAPTETSDLTFFYDCCGATDKSAPGCTRSFHISYDD